MAIVVVDDAVALLGALEHLHERSGGIDDVEVEVDIISALRLGVHDVLAEVRDLCAVRGVVFLTRSGALGWLYGGIKSEALLWCHRLHAAAVGCDGDHGPYQFLNDIGYDRLRRLVQEHVDGFVSVSARRRSGLWALRRWFSSRWAAAC